MKISLVVAMSVDGIIGQKGSSKLLWKQKADMAAFKKLTTNGIVIMGNDTFKSMGSKPLKDRFNVVLTRDKQLAKDCRADYIRYAVKPYEEFTEKYFDQSLFYINDLQQTLKDFKTVGHQKDIFIIGGESVYNLARDLSSDVAIDQLYITTLDARLGESCDNPARFSYTPDVWQHITTQSSGLADDNNTYDWKIDIYERVLNVIEI
jgi:dihydrofolate reductase